MGTSKRLVAVVLEAACALAMVHTAQAQAKTDGKLGIFTQQGDVGSVTPPGTARFDAATGVYTLASAGADLWGATDDFHFVWKKVDGDVALSADVKLAEAGTGASPFRKALLMFRQDLGPDALYADAALHGNGEVALQYRHSKGDTTQDIAFNEGAPQRMRLEKRGNTLTLFVSMHGEPLHQHGASITLHFNGPFYAGLGVCGHSSGTPEKATFSHVELQADPPLAAATTLYSTLQTISIDNNARTAMMVRTGKGQMEAPNWSRDGKTLIFNRDGRIWQIPLAGGEPTAINIGEATDCTGSHGLSPDGKWLAITCVTPGHPGRRLYILPSAGGPPRLLTETPDSYFHSWSPDGKTIAFTRPNGHGGGNILAIPMEGGSEKELTSGNGISDDPDYAHDGRYIYFNSDRAGGMQIFRMRPDGSEVQQVTFDDRRNWTPHPSPDGKSILILSYGNDVTGHPANKNVTLRILDANTGKIRELVDIVGGAGSDNVPNWAPDGGHFAFVSYEMLPEEKAGMD